MRIQKKVIAGLLQIVKKKSKNEKLNVIRVDVKKTHTNYIACGGPIMAIYISKGEQNEQEHSFSVSVESLKQLKFNSATKESFLEIEKGKVIDEAANLTLFPADLGDDYPSYKEIIPLEVSGEPGDYCLELLQDIKKCADIIFKKEKFILRQNGEKGIALFLSPYTDQFFAVIRPRSSNRIILKTTPEWIRSI